MRCDTLAEPEKSVTGKTMNCQSLETDFDDVDLKELKDIRKIRFANNGVSFEDAFEKLLLSV
ncbi:hypothetical protein [Dorea formicigenerans]